MKRQIHAPSDILLGKPRFTHRVAGGAGWAPGALCRLWRMWNL